MKKLIVVLGLFCLSIAASEAKEGKGICKVAPEIVAIQKEFPKKWAEIFKEKLRAPTMSEIAEAMGISVQKLRANVDNLKDAWTLAKGASPNAFEVAQNRVIETYIALSKEHGRTPTEEQMAEKLEITLDQLKELYGEEKLFSDFNEIRVSAMDKKPNAFKKVIDRNIYTPERLQRLTEAVTNSKRLILTTVIAGVPLMPGAFEALVKMAELKDAQIIVYPADMVTHKLDPRLLEHPRVHILTNSIELPQLRLNRIKILAKMINPLTGLERVGARGQTQIVGSPKMHVKTLATVNNVLQSHQLISTGSISAPDTYASDLYIQDRTNEIATADHMLGAVLLERADPDQRVLKMEGTGSYHFRHIEFIPEKGGFADLNKFYTEKGVEDQEILALNPGDFHFHVADSSALEALKPLIQYLKPKVMLMQDPLDDNSINPHERKKLISLAGKADRGELNLRRELSQYAAAINAIHAIDPNLMIVIPPANHPDWIKGYLQNLDFKDDPENFTLAAELAVVMNHGMDPIKYALLSGYGRFNSRDPYANHLDRKPLLDCGLDRPGKVMFLEPDPEIGLSYKVGPANRRVELAYHGHEGSGGSGGSIDVFQRAADRIMTGHFHASQRRNGAMIVGTLTPKRLPYMGGSISNWTQSVGIVGANGEMQELVFKDGQWFSEGNDKPIDDKTFFPAGLPRVIPNNEGPSGGSLDQHSHMVRKR